MTVDLVMQVADVTSWVMDLLPYVVDLMLEVADLLKVPDLRSGEIRLTLTPLVRLFHCSMGPPPTFKVSDRAVTQQVSGQIPATSLRCRSLWPS